MRLLNLSSQFVRVLADVQRFRDFVFLRDESKMNNKSTLGATKSFSNFSNTKSKYCVHVCENILFFSRILHR